MTRPAERERRKARARESVVDARGGGRGGARTLLGTSLIKRHALSGPDSRPLPREGREERGHVREERAERRGERGRMRQE